MNYVVVEICENTVLQVLGPITDRFKAVALAFKLAKENGYKEKTVHAKQHLDEYGCLVIDDFSVHIKQIRNVK